MSNFSKRFVVVRDAAENAIDAFYKRYIMPVLKMGVSDIEAQLPHILEAVGAAVGAAAIAGTPIGSAAMLTVAGTTLEAVAGPALSATEKAMLAAMVVEAHAAASTAAPGASTATPNGVNE